MAGALTWPNPCPPSRCTPSPKGWTHTTTPVTCVPSSSLSPVSGGCEWKHHTSFATWGGYEAMTAHRPIRSIDLAGLVDRCVSSGPGGHVRSQDVVGVAVQVVARPVVAHGGARIGMPSRDLGVAQIDA